MALARAGWQRGGGGAASGSVRPWAGRQARRVGARRGRWGRASLCQGICAARPSLAPVPLPARSRGAGLPPGAPGRGGRGLREPSGWRRGSLARSEPLEAPPSVARSPIPSAASALAGVVPPRGSALLPSALRGARCPRPGGLPGRGGRRRRRGKREEGRRQPSTSRERRGREPRGAREEGASRPAGAEPFVPSQKFACRDRDSCGLGRTAGRGVGGAAENRGGCLSCSPRCGGCRPGTGGGGGAHGRRTRLPEGQTNFLSAGPTCQPTVRRPWPSGARDGARERKRC